MKVTVIPVVISTHGTVREGIKWELEEKEEVGRIEIIQTTA